MALRGRFASCPYHINKLDADGDIVSYEPSKELLEYREIRGMDFGYLRRQRIILLLNKGFQFAVNGKHCVQLKDDPDLKRLLKQGKIEMFTERNSCHNFMKRTYIRKINND